MSLRLYNTLTRRLETFAPIEAGHVRMYVCGMTVYDLCHLGHARSMVAFDVVQRWLKASGYRVDVWPVAIGRKLYPTFQPTGQILNEGCSRRSAAASDMVIDDQLGVSADRQPEPSVSEARKTFPGAVGRAQGCVFSLPFL